MWNIFRKKDANNEQSIPEQIDNGVQKELPKLQVLGSIGCVSCKMQFAQMQEALKELGYPETAVEYVDDIQAALDYGIMSVPAVVVDGKVVGNGKVIKKNQLIEMLKKL